MQINGNTETSNLEHPINKGTSKGVSGVINSIADIISIISGKRQLKPFQDYSSYDIDYKEKYNLSKINLTEEEFLKNTKDLFLLLKNEDIHFDYSQYKDLVDIFDNYFELSDKFNSENIMFMLLEINRLLKDISLKAVNSIDKSSKEYEFHKQMLCKLNKIKN